MKEVNKYIYENLIRNEKEAASAVRDIVIIEPKSIFAELYNHWKGLDREELIEKMYLELVNNVNDYWVNEKYNNDLDKEFNMLLFSHGGFYGGGLLEAYAIDFDYADLQLPQLEMMDDRMDYLDNIETMEAFFAQPLLDFNEAIPDLDDEEATSKWEEHSYELYVLYEATALVLAYEVIKKANNNKLFTDKFKLKLPFYFTISEHDCGEPDKLLYVLKQEK